MVLVYALVVVQVAHAKKIFEPKLYQKKALTEATKNMNML